MKRIGYWMVMIVIMASVAMADETVGEKVVGVSSALLKGIFVGLTSGFFAAIIAWTTKKDGSGKQIPFDPNKAIPTAIFGGIIGALAGWANVDVLSLSGFIGCVSTVYLADNSWAAVWRNLAPLAKKALSDLGLSK